MYVELVDDMYVPNTMITELIPVLYARSFYARYVGAAYQLDTVLIAVGMYAMAVPLTSMAFVRYAISVSSEMLRSVIK